MSALLKFEVSAVWWECATCHVSSGMTSDHNERLRKSQKPFFCPNGHAQVYGGKTEADKVRDEMQGLLDQANREKE